MTTGQDILGVNGAEVLQPESTDKGEGESSSPSREEPPEVVAGDNVSSSSSASKTRGTSRSGAHAGDRKRATSAAAATSKDAKSKQPPLVARSLESVRGSLIRQEETIIFALIEREQFRCNTAIYTDRTFRVNRSDAADIYGRDASFLEYMLCETEKLHATGICLCGFCACVPAPTFGHCSTYILHSVHSLSPSTLVCWSQLPRRRQP